jgi:Asp-tRNA(Asn)/Glu-tRNA(Gln) amidotransferase A subunit family amidase
MRLPDSPFVAALDVLPPALRIGVCVTAPGGMRPNPEIGAAVDGIAQLLARSGHPVREFRFPASAAIGEPAAIIWMTAIAEEIDFYRERVGRSPRSHELEALTWASVAMAKRCSAFDYARARRRLTQATADMADLFRTVDVLLLPTTAEIDGRT